MKRRHSTVLTMALVAVSTLTAGSPPVQAAAEPGPGLTVDLTADRHEISRDIYGMNFADAGLQQELGLPVDRWGGNATTRFNYLNDTSNRASDWFFENIPNEVADPSLLPDGSSANQFIEKDDAAGSSTIMTVPLIGWIPKERERACGFSVEKYGPQQATDQWAPDCGNGLAPDGTPLTGNDPTDTSVPAGADHVRGWVEYLTGTYGSAAEGGVEFYNLDNEPDIWHATHRDVHPEGAGYDELRDSAYEIAGAIKEADPTAQTLGPTGWGWNSLFMSGLDQQICSEQGGSCWSNPPDRAAHGGVPFAEWYLREMAAHEAETGDRLLDYFDNHWYPQGTGIHGGEDDEATRELRLRSTRQLWDPEYVDESWINEPVALLPRMRDLVSENYPGTKLAITEYHWGALDTVNGALAQADVLGIFGREDLDLATLWAPPAPTDPGAFAYRMYLNYDGEGSSFGDISVPATSEDPDQVGVYAAERSEDGALTVMVVNKSTSDRSVPLYLAGADRGAVDARVFRYGQDDPEAIAQLPDQSLVDGQTTLDLPAYSITQLVVPGTGAATAPAAEPAPGPVRVPVPDADAAPADGIRPVTGVPSPWEG